MKTIIIICILKAFTFIDLLADEHVVIKQEHHALITLQFLHEQLEENTSELLRDLKKKDEKNFQECFRLLRFTLNESSSTKFIQNMLKKHSICAYLEQYSALFSRMTLHTKQLSRNPRTMTLYFKSDGILTDIHIKTINGDLLFISDEYLKKAKISRLDFEKRGLLLPNAK